MTPGPAEPAQAERPTAYDTRLATRIPGELDRRLRLFAVLTRRPLAHVLAELLSRQLPTDAELAARVRQMGEEDR